MTTNSTSGSAASSAHQNVNPSEVGWQFVPQYYTFLNKQPNRLHCFYTKTSTFMHGTEGEDGKPCYGQQEIHSKILSIGFQDCKVFIHSVDAQASAAGGIIIQVIGEMSNRGEPWKKFVQTFFLAEQPNGYFVLNDIFRFLKEESPEDDEAVSDVADSQAAAAAAPAVQDTMLPAPTQEQQMSEPVHEPVSAPPVNIPIPAPVQVVEPREPTPAPPVEPEPVSSAEPEKQPNGVHHEAEKTVPDVDAPAITEPEELEPAPAPVEITPAPAVAPSPAPVPATPPVRIPSPTPSQQQPIEKPQPSVPKSWATMAASNKNKWGSAVATDRTGMSVEVTTASPPASGTQTPVSHGATTPNRQQGQQHVNKNQQQQVIAQITTPHAFVKGVVEPITDEALKAELAKFGVIKHFDVVRSKACAFVEYTTLDAAKRAIAMSSEKGGIVLDCGPHGKHRVSVEIRKERGDRPPPRQHAHARGGQPTQGGGSGDRGGFRGRGRGRGTPATGGVKA